MPDTNRDAYLSFLEAQKHPADTASALGTLFAPDASINVVHPFNALTGPEAYHRTVLAPLTQAFQGLFRRNDIVMTGTFEGGQWVSATGYYVGHFAEDWLGIPATGALAYLRYGEFLRFENGRAVEAYVYLDLPELMIAAGTWPIAESPGHDRGFTGRVAGPASHDGVIRSDQDASAGQKSYQMVTDMLAGLATHDEAWRPYWHDNMVWYGPGAFGSFVGIENFAGFQVPFESAFDGWSGGSSGNGMTSHFTRYGEGNYTCSGGWPSLTGVQQKRFLGVEPTGQRVFMRVCDWWRREGDLLVENWVFVDIPDVLRQLGYDLFADVEPAG